MRPSSTGWRGRSPEAACTGPTTTGDVTTSSGWPGAPICGITSCPSWRKGCPPSSTPPAWSASPRCDSATPAVCARRRRRPTRTGPAPEGPTIAGKHHRFAPRLLTRGSQMARMGDREPRPFGGLTVRVRIRGRDQRPDQGKHWPEEPQETLQPQDGDVDSVTIIGATTTTAGPDPDVSEDPVSVADEMYEDVATPAVEVADPAPPPGKPAQ